MMDSQKRGFLQRFLLRLNAEECRIATFVGRIRFKILGAMWGIYGGCGCVFLGRADIRTLRRGQIVFGNNCKFVASSLYNPIVATASTVLDVRHGGHIEIGDNLSATSPFIGSALKVTIGNNVMISGGCKIMDTNFHSIFPDERRKGEHDDFPAEVIIGDDVFIGVGVTILKGTKIGSRSIVAAGSVVLGGDIPEDVVVSGNPATYKRIPILCR